MPLTCSVKRQIKSGISAGASGAPSDAPAPVDIEADFPKTRANCAVGDKGNNVAKMSRPMPALAQTILWVAFALWGGPASAAKPAEEEPDPFLAAHAKEGQTMRADAVVHAPVAAGRCRACHVSPEDPARLSGELKSLCLSCHPSRQADFTKANVHVPFRDFDCATCHRPHSAKEPALLSDSQAALCGACHVTGEDPIKSAHRGVTVITGACTRCHDPHASANAKLLRQNGLHVPFAARACSRCHEPPGADGKPVVKAPRDSCQSCHTSIIMAAKKAVVHPPFDLGQCMVCHEPHASAQPAMLRRPVNEICRQCHPGVPEVGHPVAGHLTFRRGRLDCRTCHEPHGSPWPKLLRGNPREICLKCHPQ